MVNEKFKQAFIKLPFEKKEAVFNILSEKVEKAKNTALPKIDRIEKNLARVLAKNWNETSTKAIEKALKTFPVDGKPFTKKDSDKLLASLEKSYKGIEKKTSKRVEDDMEEVYKLNKIGFAKQFKLNPKKKTMDFVGLKFDKISKSVVPYIIEVKSFTWSEGVEEIMKAPPAFGINDQYAWENLSRLENLAIGDHFPASLKPIVANKIKKAVLDKGLNHADASVYLKQELTKTLGGNIKGALPQSIATGEASTSAYFSGLTSTNMTFARNFSQVELMREVQIGQVIFQAIIDNLTSEVCSSMDGRVFTIEQAVEHRQKVLEVETVAELKEISPFTRNLDGFNLSDPNIQDALAKAGVIIPPLHFRCRSELHPA